MHMQLACRVLCTPPDAAVAKHDKNIIFLAHSVMGASLNVRLLITLQVWLAEVVMPANLAPLLRLLKDAACSFAHMRFRLIQECSWQLFTYLDRH